MMDVDKRLEAIFAEDSRERYLELLMAVATKCPGETRHQTALRYIREAEERRLRGWAKVGILGHEKRGHDVL